MDRADTTAAVLPGAFDQQPRATATAAAAAEATSDEAAQRRLDLHLEDARPIEKHNKSTM